MHNLKEMRFSLLMSVYNNDSPEYLAEALESVEKQTILPDETVMVIDGPIKKELWEIISLFENRCKIKCVKLERNSGLAVALKKGVEYCLNDLIARMDSDDICVTDRFENQLLAFHADPSLDVVGGLIEEFDETGSKTCLIRHVPELHLSILRRAKIASPMNHVTVMYKKSAVLESGNYKNFRGIEDYPLWVQMLMHGKKFHNIQKILVKVRAGSDFVDRRSGFRYALNEFYLLKWLYSIGFISFPLFLFNSSIRFVARLSGKRFLRIIYRSLRQRPDSE